jgi:hypothetical protein
MVWKKILAQSRQAAKARSDNHDKLSLGFLGRSPWLFLVGAQFGKLLRVPDGKTRFLTPKRYERGVRREEDEVFSFCHAQQQAVEWITVRLRSFHASQDVFVGHR